jgi:DNA-binding MarR family transcriptional regulator/GNAT superfamily N-acetyltransferase
VATIDAPSISAIRRFNRFYTRQIGTLEEGLVNTRFSLTEARILYEIANRNQATASGIASDLGLDMGYLSRILKSFAAADLIDRRSSPTDRRQALLSLTRKGRRRFQTLNERSADQVADMLTPLTPQRQQQLVSAMVAIETLLEPPPVLATPFVLRNHRPGDLGWITERHSVLYTQEYGWNGSFEAMVARIAADFIDNYSPSDEACWIADRNGERLGSVMLVRERDKAAAKIPTARLRLLLVEPAARGLGLGRALVQQCTSFARNAGYKRIVLWTNSILDSARHIYESEGYQLLSEKPHSSFGPELIGQNWQLDLESPILVRHAKE